MQVTVDGQPLFGQDYRYDTASNITEIIDKVNNRVKTYQYDQKNQLTMATTPGTFLENEVTPGNVGYRAGDYLGTATVDFGVSPQAVVSLDYHSSSIGLDFGATAPGIKKIVLTPDAAHSTHRLEAYTLALYVSADNFLYMPVPREGWEFVKEDDGTVIITLKERMATRYLKIHVLFDDRDQDFNPVNKATFLNQLAATLQVYQEGDTRTEEYEYDAEGNRTFARLQLVRTLQYYYEYYPNSNRLKSDGRYEYTYDANGNLVAKEKIRRNPSEPEEKWEYTYDLLNRLVKVVKNGSVVAEYGYDPEGYRVVKKARGETTHYVFEGTEPIFEKRIFAEGRTAVRSYVYVLGRHLARVDGVIGDPEAPVYFYHTDHLGSVRAVTDLAGEVVWRADYFAFGTRYGASGFGFEEWHGFTGKEYDPDTGLYYFNARWYDAELGRFISEDPARANNNWYIYASNNPLIRIDPTGLADYIFGTSPLKDVPSSIPSETATTPGKVIPFPQQRIQSNDAIGLAGFGVGLLQGFLLHTRDFWNEKGALKDLRPDGSFDDVTPLQIKTWQLMNERGANYLKQTLPPGFVERNGHAWHPDSGYVTFGEAWDVYNQVISGLKYGDEVSNLGKRISYAKHFENELLNFNEGYEIKQVLEKDLLLVQYHSDAEIGKGRTLKFWTTTSEANRFSTIDEVMDNLALLSMWGDRSMVSVAKVPAGTRVKHAIGTARKQINLETNEIREGGGLQILFEEFDPSWIIQTKRIGN